MLNAMTNVTNTHTGKVTAIAHNPLDKKIPHTSSVSIATRVMPICLANGITRAKVVVGSITRCVPSKKVLASASL